MLKVKRGTHFINYSISIIHRNTALKLYYYVFDENAFFSSFTFPDWHKEIKFVDYKGKEFKYIRLFDNRELSLNTEVDCNTSFVKGFTKGL